MKHRNNEILIIQTSDSSNIIITKDLLKFGEGGSEFLHYSIREGDNPLYWANRWHPAITTVINLLEFPQQNVAGKRDYISWWLNCRPSFVDETIKTDLKRRLEFYHIAGEIRNTFRNARLGPEFNADCLLEWHKILNVEYDQRLLELIPKESNGGFQELTIVTIFFDGIGLLPYSSVSLKLEVFNSFQEFLNYLYELINHEVSHFSYNNEWTLFNTRNGSILQKEKMNDLRSLYEVGLKSGDRIMCYKQ